MPVGTLLKINAVSLKEWAIIVKAMDLGKQIVLLRKGGILDKDGQIELSHREFFLFPTYEHQREEFLQEQYLPLYKEVLDSEGEFDKVRFSHYATLEKVYQITEAPRLYDLKDHYLWSEAYINLRVNYKPEIPLYLMFLRVYRMPQPREVEALVKYEGCKSWVELDQQLPTEGLQPVLSDTEYEARVQAIDKILQR